MECRKFGRGLGALRSHWRQTAHQCYRRAFVFWCEGSPGSLKLQCYARVADALNPYPKSEFRLCGIAWVQASSGRVLVLVGTQGFQGLGFQRGLRGFRVFRVSSALKLRLFLERRVSPVLGFSGFKFRVLGERRVRSRTKPRRVLGATAG